MKRRKLRSLSLFRIGRRPSFRVGGRPLLRFGGRLVRFLLRSQILTVFFGLCLLGILVGARTRPATESFPAAELFDQMSVVSYRESPSDTSARFVVQLAAGGDVFRQYDVDAREFLPPSRGRSYARTITGTHYAPLKVRGHVGYGFWLDVPHATRRALLPEQFDELYRTTLGFMKPVAQVTGVLGILSGYSVGYRIGAWNSSLSSRKVQERVLATPDLGRMIAREAWRRVLLEPVVMSGEDDASRFAAVAGTHRLYANFFRLALDDSNGFIPREAARLEALGRAHEARAMLAFAGAVQRAARDSVPLGSADFEAVERWASLLDRRGHWVQGAIPPAGKERIELLGTLAWYGLAPPGDHVDRVWVGPRVLVRVGETEGFVADEIPRTGTGCPTSWQARLREDNTGAWAMAGAWFADRPEFGALAVFARRMAGGIAGATRQLAAGRARDREVAVAPAPPPLSDVGARFAERTPVVIERVETGGEPDSGAHGQRLSVVIADPLGRIPSVARLQLLAGQAFASSVPPERGVGDEGGSGPPDAALAEGVIGASVVARDSVSAAAWSNSMASRALPDAKARASELADIDVVLIEPRHDGPNVIWIESTLKDRFILEPHARALFRVEYF